ncbi:MAG: fasciclin domain-containing protein [Anaerolineaceae bacterium]|nr:MAG: fasciclin domain-containing protein [Anaerolineaceae bacterium]
MKHIRMSVVLAMLLAAVAGLMAFTVSAQEEDSNTIVDVVVRASSGNPAQFTALLAAVQAADDIIAETLSDPAQRLTVFAPADRAFNALPEEVLDAVLNSPELLTDILLYHVLPIRATSTDVLALLEENQGGFVVETLLGETIEVISTDRGIFINDAFLRTDGGLDFFADNGVIHIIESVLIPPSLQDAVAAIIAGDAPEAAEEEEAGPPTGEDIASAVGRLLGSAGEAEEEEEEEAGPPTGEDIASAVGRLMGSAGDEAEEEAGEPTIAEIAAGNEDFSTLVMVLSGAAPDFLELLSDPASDFTVFAPTNDAFDALGAALGIDIEAAMMFPDILVEILAYHVVEGTVPAEVVVTLDGEAVETVQGESIVISIVDGGVVLNGMVNVVATDIFASNGVIHVIDGVLLSESTIATLGALGISMD